MPLSMNPTAIKSEERTLGAILSDKIAIHVPVYQRSFSWTKSEISDLWDDLQDIIFNGHESHFFGSMVFIQKPDASLEVVDGQQRLATISLLLAVIRDAYNGVKDMQRAQHVETQYLCSRRLRTMEASPKLSMNEIDNDLFSKIIEAGKSYDDLTSITKNNKVFESNRLIARAYMYLFDQVKKGSNDFTNAEYLSTLVEVVTDSITCIQIITSTEESAYVLFETLNDRGIDLTLSDMLKNFLFSKAGKRIDEVKHKWTEIVTLIGQEYMKTFIRHEWMSRFGQTREKELFKRIKYEMRSNPKVVDYINGLRNAATVYDAIRNPDNELWVPYGTKCRNLLEEILLLGPVQCYPLILATYFEKPKDLNTILQCIVNLTVRYSIICAKGTGNLESTYARASISMRSNLTKLKATKDILLEIFPKDEEFITNFKEKTLSSSKIIKYLFSKIEMSLSGTDGLLPNPEMLSVEHILPKKPSSKWPAAMRSAEFLREYLNRIGNLSILTEPMNRDCESKEFSSKKDIYSKCKYKITNQLCSYDNWSNESIITRQGVLSEIAAKVWEIN
jgi:uncharacterized protein with ParB-like and HNH nuclease domain